FAEMKEHLRELRVTTVRRAERVVKLPKRTFDLYEEFLAQVRGRAKWLSAEDVFRTHRVLLAADASARRGGAKVRV
ncbi:MAG TPA: hypothetical protein VMY39_00705, partial [Planctomycetota bacterium]|nr:hypothetical protein [Planctomycetota bacterium]